VNVMASLEERVSRHEGVLEQMNERLGNLEQGQQALRSEMTQGQQAFRSEMTQGQRELRSEIQALHAEIRSNFRWTVGIMLAMWITVMGAVLGALLTR